MHLILLVVVTTITILSRAKETDDIPAWSKRNSTPISLIKDDFHIRCPASRIGKNLFRYGLAAKIDFMIHNANEGQDTQAFSVYMAQGDTKNFSKSPQLFCHTHDSLDTICYRKENETKRIYILEEGACKSDWFTKISNMEIQLYCDDFYNRVITIPRYNWPSLNISENKKLVEDIFAIEVSSDEMCEVRLLHKNSSYQEISHLETIVSLAQVKFYWIRESNDEYLTLKLTSPSSNNNVTFFVLRDKNIVVDGPGCSQSVAAFKNLTGKLVIYISKTDHNFTLMINRNDFTVTCQVNENNFRIFAKITAKWSTTLFSNLFYELLSTSSCVIPNNSYVIDVPSPDSTPTSVSEFGGEVDSNSTIYVSCLKHNRASKQSVVCSKGQWEPKFDTNTCKEDRPFNRTVILIGVLVPSLVLISVIVIISVRVLKRRKRRKRTYTSESVESHFTLEHRKYKKTKIFPTIFTRKDDISIQYVFPEELLAHQNRNCSTANISTTNYSLTSTSEAANDINSENTENGNRTECPVSRQRDAGTIRSRILAKSIIEDEPVHFNPDYDNMNEFDDYGETYEVMRQSINLENNDEYIDMQVQKDLTLKKDNSKDPIYTIPEHCKRR